MVLTLIPRSPRRRIRLVTVICGLKGCPNPVGPTRLRKFNTSNGCQNHTASQSAASIVRLRAIRQLTGRIDPPCHPLTSPDAAASTASRPAFVTTRDPPLLSRRDGEGFRSDLGQARRKIFLQKGLDRPFRKTRSDLPVGADLLKDPHGEEPARRASRTMWPVAHPSRRAP
jgi:hypothetical protein